MMKVLHAEHHLVRGVGERIARRDRGLRALVAGREQLPRATAASARAPPSQDPRSHEVVQVDDPDERSRASSTGIAMMPCFSI